MRSLFLLFLVYEQQQQHVSNYYPAAFQFCVLQTFRMSAGGDRALQGMNWTDLLFIRIFSTVTVRAVTVIICAHFSFHILCLFFNFNLVTRVWFCCFFLFYCIYFAALLAN